MGKISFLFVFMAYSANALACPNLSGTFECRSSGGMPYDVTVTQSVQNGVTTYEMTGDDSHDIMIADGRSHDYESDNGKLRNGTYRAVCRADQVDQHMEAELFNEDGKWGDMVADVEYSRGEAGSLVAVTDGEIKYELGNFPIDSRMECPLK